MESQNRGGSTPKPEKHSLNRYLGKSHREILPKKEELSRGAAVFLPKTTAKIAVFARFSCKLIYLKKALPG